MRLLRKCHIEDKHTLEVRILKRGEENKFSSRNVAELKKDDTQGLADLDGDRTISKARESLKRGTVLGSFEAEKLVGSVSLSKILPSVFYLGGLIVEPEYRNKGVGTCLASRAVENAFHKHNANYVCLYMWGDNIPAKRVFEKVGFKQHRVLSWLDHKVGFKRF